MLLTNQLERHRGLFLDSASTLFFRGVRSRRGEVSEDNSSSAAASLSSDQIGALPLSCLTGGAGDYSLVRFRSVHLPYEYAGGRFLVADGRHDSATRPSVLHVPPALPPYPVANEGTDP